MGPPFGPRSRRFVSYASHPSHDRDASMYQEEIRERQSDLTGEIPVSTRFDRLFSRIVGKESSTRCDRDHTGPRVGRSFGIEG